jgi:hypothetical protein
MMPRDVFLTQAEEPDGKASHRGEVYGNMLALQDSRRGRRQCEVRL